MVNQKEIALKAGVSRATVSRYFTQKANIHPETCRKIQQAMQALGMSVPEDQSRQGSMQKYVMVISSDISNEFYSRILKGCCNALAANGIHTVVCDSDNSVEYERDCIHTAIKERYGGIILINAVEEKELVELLRSTTIPFVMSNRYIHSLASNMVCIDNYDGGYAATTHLIENGHTKIAFFGSDRSYTPVQDRYRGYLDALENAGLTPPKGLSFFGDGSIACGRRFASESLEKGLNYTAVFATCCPLAVGAVKQYTSRGYQVPEDISLVCFDDSPLIDENGLNLTTVSCDPCLIGQETAAVLQCAMDGVFKSITTTLLSPHLIQRESVLDIRRKGGYV